MGFELGDPEDLEEQEWEGIEPFSLLEPERSGEATLPVFWWARTDSNRLIRIFTPVLCPLSYRPLEHAAGIEPAASSMARWRSSI